MAINVSQIAQSCLKPFNSKGYRLLSKETGLEIKNIKSFISKKEVPKNAFSMDLVKIESDFGSGTKDILSLRDKDGTLLKRVVKECQDNIERVKTINTYEKETDFVKTIRQKYSGETEVQNINEAVSINKLTSPLTIDRVKLTVNNNSNGTRSEHQVFEEFTKRSKDRKYLETRAIRDSDGTLCNKEITGNISDAGFNELKNDPYLYARNYNFKDFARSIFPFLKKLQNVENQDIKLKLGYILGMKGGASFISKHIKVDCSKQDDFLDLVDTLNHELRHRYQASLEKQLGFFNYLFGKTPKNTKLTEEELEMARKFKSAWYAYDPHYINRDSYFNNFLEVDARKYGDFGKDHFIDATKKLMSFFPMADARLFNLKSIFTDTLKQSLIANNLKGHG